MRMARWIAFLCILGCVSTNLHGEIVQWTDGDGDGSLWLSDSPIEPYVILNGEVLWWANLPGANLHHAQMQYVNLMFAELPGANISAGNLSFANLTNANLINTDLAFTILHGANLANADIALSNLFHADITDANLTGIQNWEEAFWLTARYNENTIFPEGMHPEDYAMIYMEVPAPGNLLWFVTIGLFTRRRN